MWEYKSKFGAEVTTDSGFQLSNVSLLLPFLRVLRGSRLKPEIDK